MKKRFQYSATEGGERGGGRGVKKERPTHISELTTGTGFYSVTLPADFILPPNKCTLDKFNTISSFSLFSHILKSKHIVTVKITISKHLMGTYIFNHLKPTLI
jgi:hypothetical protein